MNELTGKTVIITGASKGIGAATVKHFANLGSERGYGCQINRQA